jgi:hypothetical protein
MEAMSPERRPVSMVRLRAKISATLFNLFRLAALTTAFVVNNQLNQIKSEETKLKFMIFIVVV